MSVLTDIGGIALNALTGGVGGGLLRLLPEVLKLFVSKADRDHEYRMAQLQRDMAKDGSEQRIREQESAGAVAIDNKAMDAYIEAIKAQGQKTGIYIADLLNALVRPIVTYYFLAMYGLYKLALFLSLWTVGNVGFAGAVMACWTPADEAQFGGLLAFWFVGRVLDNQRRTR